MTAVNPVSFDTIKLIWRPAPRKARRVVATLIRRFGAYTFNYDGPDLVAAQNEGFSGYPGMEDVSKDYSHQAMVAFASRLISRERPDFDRIVSAWGASPEMDDFTLLGLTFGRLPTDMYEFIPKIAPIPGTCFFTDLAGLQSHTPSEAFRLSPPGTPLVLRRNPANEHDGKAVEVLLDGEIVAHVKKVHCESVCEAFDAGLSVSCELVRVLLNGVIKQVVVKIQYL